MHYGVIIIQPQDIGARDTIPLRYRTALELEKVLAQLAEHAATADAKAHALALEPVPTLREAVMMMDETAAASSLGRVYGCPAIYALTNCTQALARAEVGAALSFRELLDISLVLRNIRTLSEYGKRLEGESCIHELFELLVPNKALEDRISRSFISDEEMADSASSELADIRRRIRSSHGRIREQLEKLIRSQSHQKYLQDQLVTMRDGRFVVPVKSEYRGEIKGLVHDTSSSGATVFIEPVSVVEANNEIKILEGREQQEIDRIIRELSALAGAEAGVIDSAYRMVVYLDLLFAKAKLADRMKAVVPELNGDGRIHLKQARHPLIPRQSVVPVDVWLGADFDTLVVTGPNTGGKTVALKTVGLLTLMAMCGLMLPAGEGSRVSVFSNILVDIGDEQSIEQSLSTFSAHMTNIIAILEAADSHSLVLLDELGAGTDPVEGAALAVAILEQLREMGCRVVATTHYAEIKMFALETKGVENASCEFDVATLRPTYRLLIGIPGRSNAFAISRRLGLSDPVIERAQRRLSGESSRFEEVVGELEAARQAVDRERSETESLRVQARQMKEEATALRARQEAEYEKELEAARVQARRIVEQVRYEADFLIEELTELQRQQDKADFSQRAAQAKAAYKSNLRRLYDMADPVGAGGKEDVPLTEVSRGDDVTVISLGKTGTVISVPDSSGYVQVQLGIIKTRVLLSDLRPADTKPISYRKGSVSRKVKPAAQPEGVAEFDMRGMNIEEGLMELDRFIDNAVLAGVKNLSIIHGKGTGVLREAVHQHLRRHKGVRTYRLGVFGEGDAGVTIAELK